MSEPRFGLATAKSPLSILECKPLTTRFRHQHFSFEGLKRLMVKGVICDSIKSTETSYCNQTSPSITQSKALVARKALFHGGCWILHMRDHTLQKKHFPN